jgi:hypothetical protein
MSRSKPKLGPYSKRNPGYARDPKSFWEKCGKKFAHIDLKNKDACFRYWGKFFGKSIDVKGKNVIDYGIGGGFLGEYLYSKHGIKKYIGIDIASRSLEATKRRLKKYPQTTVHLAPVEFRELGGDVFASFACIQHFPTDRYYNGFFRNINRSKIETVILQFRLGEKKMFRTDVPRLSCYTTFEDIERRLSAYETIFREGGTGKSKYAVIGLSLKKEI